MPAPTKLAIATSSVKRLVKEESSYHKELAQQQERIEKLEQSTNDEEIEYQLKQERKAVEETKAMFPQLKRRIQEALAQLELQLEGADVSTDEATAAKEAVAEAKKAIGEEL